MTTGICQSSAWKKCLTGAQLSGTPEIIFAITGHVNILLHVHVGCKLAISVVAILLPIIHAGGKNTKIPVS